MSSVPVERPDDTLDARVRVLAPTPATGSWSDFLAGAHAEVREPFASERCDTIGRLSEALLRDPVLRRDPASVAAAYWIRRAAVARLEEVFRAKQAAEPGVVRVPVGRVLHLSPSNVDTLFVYPWVLSFLCGNANVVRVSRERTPVVEAMLRALDAVSLERPELARGNRFVTYEHDADVTAALSRWCSHRIIWGGDETVAALRPLELNPHASERVFGSKFSYAVIDAAGYLAADEAERTKLAGAFWNDLFWFDQMACSSPHVVFWVGEASGSERAVDDFERRLELEVERRGWAPDASASVGRLNFAFRLAATSDVRVHLEHRGFVGIRVRDARAVDKQICGGGLIRHARLERLEDLGDFAGEADQTVTHFGFDRDRLEALAARVGARGVDRIVPVGEALSFGVVWDGFDLLDDLTRRVAVRT